MKDAYFLSMLNNNFIFFAKNISNFVVPEFL